MIEITGRFNTARIMIDQIDDVTRTQIQGFLDHPAFAGTRIVIMPDCHAGRGAVIGFTMTMGDFIVPNVIGVDIGCGMLTARYPAQDIDLPALDRWIRTRIPAGFSINQGIKHVEDRELVQDLRKVAAKIGVDADRALRAVGSLGGGNHFIELGRDSRDNLYLTIHSGSRNFGKRVADYYQARAHQVSGRKRKPGMSRDLDYLPLDSPEAKDYFFALNTSQRFAQRNREEMLRRIESFLRREAEETIESVHNFIDPGDQIIRKGATPARRGERVIIPFNMRDGIALCRGKGNKDYNFSAPHGAGRILSRSQAKRSLSLEDFRKEMEGVYTTTAVRETLDEAPGAYKDMQLILDNIGDTVEVETLIKPIYNFKAAGD